MIRIPLIKKNIPNLFTCANLFCGCLGIVFAFQGNLVWTAYMVGIAAVADFLDGFVARLLKVHSEIGKQLDSLADMVTFGVVPGVVMYQLLCTSLFANQRDMMSLFNGHARSFLPTTWNNYGGEWVMYLPYIGFLITIFSAVRLAKFNIDTRQSDSFIGVPTPANSILICSLPLTASAAGTINSIDLPDGGTFTMMESDLTHNPWFLIILTVVMSYLLVAELPLFALKFKNFGWADNKIRYLFLALSLTMLIIFQYLGIPFIIVLYILLSLINNLVAKKS